MADFASVGDLETFMGQPGLGARGTAMLGYASAEIRGFTRQDLDVVTGRQEEFAGDASQLLQLTETPVTAVSSITEDGVAFTDFVWSRWGSIHKSDWSAWDTGPIIVTYDSGYATNEDEFLQIKSICLEVASRALGGPQSPEFANYGIETPELRGAAPAIFLTDSEKQVLSTHAQVTVG